MNKEDYLQGFNDYKKGVFEMIEEYLMEELQDSYAIDKEYYEQDLDEDEKEDWDDYSDWWSEGIKNKTVTTYLTHRYNGYILEGYTSGIEGQYGKSTAVRLIEPGTGRRQTLWLTGYEQEHLKNHLATWQDAEGATFPMEIKFLRHKVPSKNGRKYNRFSATLLNHGENLVIPPVPEEQYESQDEN